MKHTFIPSRELSKTNWYLIDAENICLGRLATTIVKLLLGKTLPFYMPGQIFCNYVIVINAEKLIVTGSKKKNKLYMRHSGRPGGKKIETFEQLSNRIPTRILELAVKGMLPKNHLGRKIFTKLKVYQDKTHPHLAQKPQLIVF